MFSNRLMKRLTWMMKMYASLDKQGLLTGSDLLHEVLVHLVKLSQLNDLSEPILLRLAKLRAIDVLRNAELKPRLAPLPDENLEEGWALAAPGPDLDLKIDFARALNKLTPQERLLLPLMAALTQREQAALTRLSRRQIAEIHQSIRCKFREAGLNRYLHPREIAHHGDVRQVKRKGKS